MRLFIPDIKEFFAWMQAEGHLYVVMRGFFGYAEKGFPAAGSKEDVDVLVDDSAIVPLQARYGAYKKMQGIKCDIHNRSGCNPVTLLDKNDRGGWKNKFYPEKVYPEKLASYMLEGRVLHDGGFYVPSPMAHLAGLLYHITYQKQEASGIHVDDATQSSGSKYIPELKRLFADAGVDIPLTLQAFHLFLEEKGLSAPYANLVSYVQNDFRNGFNSFFRAWVFAREKGEMNMFVIRQVALKHGLERHILRDLRAQYEILAVKQIPFFTKMTKSRHMRGNKWRRGGKPCIAVIVYDPAPIAPEAEDRKLHGFVLNARQFMKRGLREWFTAQTGEKASRNPIHSTDNEAEAVGHLPLFFTPCEVEDILLRLEQRRQQEASCAR